MVGKYNEKVFDERDVQFTLGEGEASNIIEGIEEALRHFKLEEKSRLKIKSKYAFKTIGNAEFNIPPSADVEYIVELKNFEKVFNCLYLLNKFISLGEKYLFVNLKINFVFCFVLGCRHMVFGRTRKNSTSKTLQR